MKIIGRSCVISKIKISSIRNVLQLKAQIVKLQGVCLAFCTSLIFSFVVHNELIKCCAKNNSCDFNREIPVTQYNCMSSDIFTILSVKNRKSRPCFETHCTR